MPDEQFTDAERRQLVEIAGEVVKECVRSRKIHGRFPTSHHAEGVIREEFEELWDEIKQKNPRRDKMRTEAIQLAAAAVHLITDICGD